MRLGQGEDDEGEDVEINTRSISGNLEKAQARRVVVDAVARAYGTINRWLSYRIGRNLHSPEGEQKLADEMVDILEIGEKELGPASRALFAHGVYYMEVLALPPPPIYQPFADVVHDTVADEGDPFFHDQVDHSEEE